MYGLIWYENQGSSYFLVFNDSIETFNMPFSPGYSEIFVQRLNTLLNSFTYAWFSYVVIIDDELTNSMANKGFLLIDGHFKLELVDVLRVALEDRDRTSREFVFFALRAAIVGFYEAFKGDEIRYGAVKNEPWFLLLASLRHSLSHGIEGEWRRFYTNNDGKALTFIRACDSKELVLQKSLCGQPINLEMATYVDIFRQAVNFAKRAIS